MRESARRLGAPSVRIAAAARPTRAGPRARVSFPLATCMGPVRARGGRATCRREWSLRKTKDSCVLTERGKFGRIRLAHALAAEAVGVAHALVAAGRGGAGAQGRGHF